MKPPDLPRSGAEGSPTKDEEKDKVFIPMQEPN